MAGKPVPNHVAAQCTWTKAQERAELVSDSAAIALTADHGKGCSRSYVIFNLVPLEVLKP